MSLPVVIEELHKDEAELDELKAQLEDYKNNVINLREILEFLALKHKLPVMDEVLTQLYRVKSGDENQIVEQRTIHGFFKEATKSMNLAQNNILASNTVVSGSIMKKLTQFVNNPNPNSQPENLMKVSVSLANLSAHLHAGLFFSFFSSF